MDLGKYTLLYNTYTLNQINMKKIILSVFMCLVAVVASAQVARPKLVVGLVVDQMRWDYLYYYYDKYGEGGMKRLLAEGFSCDNQMLNYVPTVTGVGHASIYTGAAPSTNGIAANDFYLGDKRIYCCDDPNVKGVGTTDKAGMMSPVNMLGTTVGDMLRAASDYRSKVIGVALKDRASILPAGHSANAAYWYDKSVAGFITSTWYMEQLPEWVKKFNKASGMKKGYDPKVHADGVTLTFRMAEAALKNEQLGKGDATDMLCISVSSTDAISHQTGTWLSPGKENEEAFLTLDRGMKEFFDALDAQVGKGNYLLFLTADHGGTHNPNTTLQHRRPGGSWDSGATMKQLNEQLKGEFGADIRYVKDIIGESIYLDHNAISGAKLCLDKVKGAAVRLLMDDPQFNFVVDYEKAASAPVPQWIRERIINGYYRGRSGDIMAMPKVNYYDWHIADDFYGSTHGSWSAADTHIPLVFMGWHIKPGHTNRQTFMVDTAPTICALLHIQMPDACIGNAITEVTD